MLVQYNPAYLAGPAGCAVAAADRLIPRLTIYTSRVPSMHCPMLQSAQGLSVEACGSKSAAKLTGHVRSSVTELRKRSSRWHELAIREDQQL
jgi:hypothetical protein